ncbi:MAG TPA: hypothetical protein VNW92_25765, partial [Polyangiaceae bacterium]|nr:hypothetical protein [Polyangiaceae bacterium]
MNTKDRSGRNWVGLFSVVALASGACAVQSSAEPTEHGTEELTLTASSRPSGVSARGASRSASNLVSLLDELRLIDSWIRRIFVELGQPQAGNTPTCQAAYLASGLGAGADLNAVLQACPQIADHIVWQDGPFTASSPGSAVPWQNWSANDRAELASLYSKLVQNGSNPYADIGLSCPNPLDREGFPNAALTNGQSSLYYTRAQAFDIYAASVANAMYLEVMQQVPWSLLDYGPNELDALFDSSALFAPIKPTGNPENFGYPSDIVVGRDYQNSPRNGAAATFLCDPREGLLFMNGRRSTAHQNLIGSNQTATLANLTFWATNNVFHGPNGGAAPAIEQERQFYAFDLADRLKQVSPALVAATTQANAPISSLGILSLLGCHTTSQLLADLARSVNIPLLVTAMHTAPTSSAGGPHGSLVYGVGTDHELILEHADDTDAEGYLPAAPLLPDGSALPSLLDTRIAPIEFASVWRDPTTLGAWGLALESGFPPIPDTNASSDLYDDGLALGDWTLSPADAPSSGVSYFLTDFLFDHSYDLCGADTVSLHCHQLGFDSAFESQLSIDSGALLGTPSLPSAHTLADYLSRMESCVNAYGGCAQISALQSARLSGFGANVWLTCNAADTNLDPHNCGACGHDCGCGACSNGVCQAYVVAAPPEVQDVAFDGQQVVWSDNVTGTLSEATVSGGAPVTLATLALAVNHFTGVSINGGAYAFATVSNQANPTLSTLWVSTDGRPNDSVSLLESAISTFSGLSEDPSGRAYLMSTLTPAAAAAGLFPGPENLMVGYQASQTLWSGAI